MRAFCAGIPTAYYVIRGTDGTIWYPTGQVFETFGTAGRTMADYDLGLVNKSGGYFVGSFDTNVSVGYYYWAAHYQTTGAPIDADPPVWAEWGYWNATTWTPSVKSPWDELMADHTGETTFGGELGTLDPNITLILEDTGTTIPGLIAALPAASGIADAVWNDLIASHTAEASFGGELQQLDPNLTFVLADTSAYDTDAEHAAAIWNALMATYAIELSFGGEVQQLDPNVTLIKAITDILPALSTTVASATDPNTFVLSAGLDANDVYCGMTIYVQDATDSHWESRLVIDWEVGRTVTVDVDFGFTPAAADRAYLWGQAYFPLDVYNGLPMPPKPEVITVDRRASTAGGGTTTLDVEGLDPP